MKLDINLFLYSYFTFCLLHFLRMYSHSAASQR